MRRAVVLHSPIVAAAAAVVLVGTTVWASTPAPIAERPAPFDVELGPSGSGVAAVYSRCADAATARGCHIAELELGVAGATERTLAPPGGGSVHEPAIWKNQIVFLRHNPAGGSRRPDNLFAWSIGSRKCGSRRSWSPRARTALEVRAGRRA